MADIYGQLLEAQLENLSANPSSTYTGRAYFNTTTKKAMIYDGVVWKELGSGSGSGGINYLSSNPDGESVTTGWAAFADAAAATPVDLTGGSPNSTFTRSTSSPLRGTASFLWTKAGSASRQGEGFSFAYTSDSADLSKVMQISFDVDASDSNYTDDEMKVWIYDVTNAALIYPAVQAIKKAKYTFQTTFVATTGTSYRFGVYTAGTSTSNYTIKFDNFQLGPVLATLGVPKTEPQSLSLTFSSGFGTVTNNSAKYIRDGNMLEGWGSFTSGTVAASLGAIIFPTGLTVDTTALTRSNDTSSAGNVVGWVSSQSGASPRSANLVTCPLTSTSGVYVAGGITSGNHLVPVNIGTTFDSTAVFSFWFRVPIAEWAGASVSLSTAQPEYAYNSNTTSSDDTTSFAYGPEGALMPNRSTGTAANKRVRWLTPIQPTDKIILEFNDTIGWYPAAQQYPYTMQGSVEYGAQVFGIDSTTSVVTFSAGGFRASSGTYASNGQAWSVLYSSNYKWRLVKIPGHVQVASPTTVKYQKKALATSTTSTGTIASLGFNGLTVGRTYRLTGMVQTSQVSASAGGKQWDARITNNGVLLCSFFHSSEATTNDNTRLEMSTGVDVIFVAAASTTVFTVQTNAASVTQLCGSAFGTNCTYLQLEELTTHVATTEWT